MITVYKYGLETTDLQSIKIPKLKGETDFRKQFLCIDTQHTFPCLWCLVDTEEETREVFLRVVGTGNPMPDDISREEYLGSYQLLGGNFVGHVFLEKGINGE